MSVQIFRVTCRGQFGRLDDDSCARLLAEAPVHDHMNAMFTRDGTFTYDTKLQAFSFRYEVRVKEDEDPVAIASGLANAYLERHGIVRNDWWRTAATDMATMWRPSRRG